MKRFRNFLCICFLAALCLFLHSEERFSDPFRLYVGGTELTAGGTLHLGGGTAEYDPESQVLTLTDARVVGNTHGAGIYANGDLCIRLEGSSTVSGQRSGVTVLGNLTLCGSGSGAFSGGSGGASVRGCVTVYDSAGLTLAGSHPLRWGKLHISPLDTVYQEARLLSVAGPYTVLLLDGAADAAGHSLTGGESLLRQFSVRVNQPVPCPEDPEREGYWFDGWYADENLETPFDFTKSCDSAVALYAKWIQIVTLHLDSYGGSELADMDLAWGELPTAPEEPTREGFRFLGWYADEGLKTPYNWQLPLETDTTVYAKWEKIADLVAYGIDAARYQGDVDWAAVKADGVSFVFLRIGFRGYGREGNLHPDDNFEANYEAAVAAGLDVGVYFFSQAVNTEEAQDEAKYILELLDGRTLHLPVVLDYELASNGSGGLLGRLYEANLSGEDYAAICLAFCDYMEYAGGYTAAVYAGQSMLREGVGEALDNAGYAVWLAHWTVQTRYNGDYTYWQYSGSGHVDGIDTEVDLDVRYVDIPEAVSSLKQYVRTGYNALYWDRMPGVQGYIVYRSDSGSGRFVPIGEVSGLHSYTDYEGTADSRYRVCAWVSYGQQQLCGPMSAIAEPESSADNGQ